MMMTHGLIDGEDGWMMMVLLLLLLLLMMMTDLVADYLYPSFLLSLLS